MERQSRKGRERQWKGSERQWVLAGGAPNGAELVAAEQTALGCPDGLADFRQVSTNRWPSGRSWEAQNTAHGATATRHRRRKSDTRKAYAVTYCGRRGGVRESRCLTAGAGPACRPAIHGKSDECDRAIARVAGIVFTERPMTSDESALIETGGR